MRFARHTKRYLGALSRAFFSFLLILSTVISMGGGALFSLLFPFDAPKIAEAAYTGKHLKTIEYVLGGGTENTAQGTGVISYAGSSWNTVKGTAGTRNIVISGSNIHVTAAYLDVGYIVTTSVSLTDEATTIDVGGSSSGGTDTPVGEEASTNPYRGTGGSGYRRQSHDVTALFDRQSDASWAAGVPVVASVAITGGTRALTTVKLVITYESDYSLVAHTETKTVKFQLASLAASDRGSRGTACAATATCSFAATSTIPDASADADILDAHIEMFGEVDSATASTFQFGITGGTASSSAFAWTEVIADQTFPRAIWELPIGSPDFQRNTTMRINVLMGSVPMNALGGVLVITYKYSTGATAQTETVSYFLDQETTAPGTGRVNFPTTTMTVSQGGMSMKSIWMEVHNAPYAASNITLYGKVGTSTEVSRQYTLTSASQRSGDDFTIILDMSDKAGNFFTASTAIAAAFQDSAAAAVSPPSAEVFLTFTWQGDLGGPQTQSVRFSGTQQGVDPAANSRYNRSVGITLPETVTKTYRSAYIYSKVTHSGAGGTTIALGTITLGANASTTVITEIGDTEAFTATYLTQIASSTFSDGDTIAWTSRKLEINNAQSAANVVKFGNVVVVTYDAAQELKVPTFAQNYFRFYVDSNTLTPNDPWPTGAVNMAENAEITAADRTVASGENLRIRMSLQVATTTMTASSTSFKLQYAPRVSTCGALANGSWNDLGAPGSGSIWRGFNAAPADGTQLAGGDPPPVGTTLLSVTDRAGTYEEQNNTAVNPFAAAVGEDVEYDWNVQQNSAATDTPYCFRMTKADGTAFWNYNYYPTITTQGFAAEQRNWRWYDDETNETPNTPLSGAAENTAPANVAWTGDSFKLRVTLAEVNGMNGSGQKFRVQFSTFSDFSADVHFADATTSCNQLSVWCYGDGVDNDNDPITARKLSDSTANGTHNEGTTTTSFSPPASTATEYEYTLTGKGALQNTAYFFRIWDMNHGKAVPLGTGKSYPSLSTAGATLSASSAGLATSTVTEGVTTDIGTTATSAPFGALVVSAGKTAAQRLTITTDAPNGYQVFLGANSNFVNETVGEIPGVTGTNASPSAWATGCVAGASGCWGYHAGDNTLSGGSTRFLADDTYAKFATTTAEEVAYNSGPVTNDVTDVIYRIEVHSTQPKGSYTVQLTYIIVPTF